MRERFLEEKLVSLLFFDVSRFSLNKAIDVHRFFFFAGHYLCEANVLVFCNSENWKAISLSYENWSLEEAKNWKRERYETEREIVRATCEGEYLYRIFHQVN